MSFIEKQRRRQIIDATIAVLARSGVAQTSLSGIAAQAGISKSIISYHFNGKDEIFEQVFGTVSSCIEAALAPQIERATTPWARIAAYIDGQLRHMRDHRQHLLAIGHIALSHIGTGTTPDYIAAASVEEHNLLRGWLFEGQSNGDFASFDTSVMAATIAGAIESTLSQWAENPETDLDHYSKELIALFDRAVRS